MVNNQLSIKINGKYFDLQQPQSVSRPVILHPTYSSSGAFYLPSFSVETFELKGQFVGDINRGGSCNVDIHSYTPHNLTHLETVAHLTSNGTSVVDINKDVLTGMCYLVDLANHSETDGLIKWEDISHQISNLADVTHLAIKTSYSISEYNHNFSGKTPIALDPQLTKSLYSNHSKIKALLLDLPSVDTVDSIDLLAHRNFFGLDLHQTTIDQQIQRVIVELAYFNSLDEGYYYCIMTPPKIQTNAAITDILFYPVSGFP